MTTMHAASKFCPQFANSTEFPQAILRDSEFVLNFHEDQKDCLNPNSHSSFKNNTPSDMPLLDAASQDSLEAVLVPFRFLPM